jgi:hypothetical protein
MTARPTSPISAVAVPISALQNTEIKKRNLAAAEWLFNKAEVI